MNLDERIDYYARTIEYGDKVIDVGDIKRLLREVLEYVKPDLSGNPPFASKLAQYQAEAILELMEAKQKELGL